MLSGKYFEGCIADDISFMRIVGLDKRKQQELDTQKEANSAGILENCTVGKSKYSAAMEVVLTSSTTIAVFPCKFSRTLPSTTPTDTITLSQLQQVQNSHYITVTCKALRVHPKTEVKPGLFKQ